jgi:hypothetical protein
VDAWSEANCCVPHWPYAPDVTVGGLDDRRNGDQLPAGTRGLFLLSREYQRLFPWLEDHQSLGLSGTSPPRPHTETLHQHQCVTGHPQRGSLQTKHVIVTPLRYFRFLPNPFHSTRALQIVDCGHSTSCYSQSSTTFTLQRRTPAATFLGARLGACHSDMKQHLLGCGSSQSGGTTVATHLLADCSVQTATAK